MARYPSNPLDAVAVVIPTVRQYAEELAPIIGNEANTIAEMARPLRDLSGRIMEDYRAYASVSYYAQQVALRCWARALREALKAAKQPRSNATAEDTLSIAVNITNSEADVICTLSIAVAEFGDMRWGHLQCCARQLASALRVESPFAVPPIYLTFQKGEPRDKDQLEWLLEQHRTLRKLRTRNHELVMNYLWCAKTHDWSPTTLRRMINAGLPMRPPSTDPR